MLRKFEAQVASAYRGNYLQCIWVGGATSAVVLELGLSNKATFEAEKEDLANGEDDEGIKSTNAVVGTCLLLHES